MKTIVTGLPGSTLDKGLKPNRWDRWRPSICICQQDNLLINQYHLLYQKQFKKLSSQIIKDIQTVSPETEVVPHEINYEDPWDFEEVYETQYTFAANFTFMTEEANYLLHITTGTHVAQICIFLLTESRHFPGKLLQTSPSRNSCGTYEIIDLDLSRYDRIAARFQEERNDDISFLKYGIETRNKSFNKLIEQVEYVVLRTHEPVLLTGPTGAGKSQLAKRIHELKKAKGQIKDDLLARVNLWTFELPGLKERPEDIAPNITYELKKFEERYGKKITFNKEGRVFFIAFAVSPDAPWNSNFRDLNAAITRMCTLASSGRINKEICLEEIDRADRLSKYLGRFGLKWHDLI